MTTKDLKSQLQHLELEINRMKQSVEDSSIAPQSSNGKLSYKVVDDDDWNFTSVKSNHRLTALAEILSTLTKPGDKIEIGPFSSDKEARRAQTRVGYTVYKTLRWPRPEGEPAYESHTLGANLFVKRLV